jgi:hypothetical protein
VVATLGSWQIEQAITPGEECPVGVKVQLSSGEQRWCLFATPSMLQRGGDRIDGTEVRFHFLNRHLIVASELSEELIGRMLRHLDSQGDLVACTSPLGDGDEGHEVG